MVELFFDTETTGIPPKNSVPENYEKYEKCRIVSIAWVLRDKKTIYSQKYSVVDPGIPDKEIGAEFIHGINREIIDKFGTPVEEVIHDFISDVKKADIIIAHNITFDKNVILSELYRMGSPIEADVFKNHKNLCTMLSTVNLVKKLNKWGKNKWPRLEELYVFLFGKNFENAHHALGDIDALSRCYYELKDKHDHSNLKKLKTSREIL